MNFYYIKTTFQRSTRNRRKKPVELKLVEKILVETKVVETRKSSKAYSPKIKKLTSIFKYHMFIRHILNTHLTL